MYTKYTESNKNYVLFAYKRSDIFDDVCHLSAFMAKNAATKEGQPLLEQYAISEDEEPMFLLCLRDCLPDIWEVFVKLTHGETSPFNAAETHTEATTIGDITLAANETYITLRINDSLAYNPNLLSLVDSSIRSAIEQGILEKWYTRIAQTELLKVASMGFASESTALTRRLIQLYRKSVYPPITTS